MKILVAPDSFKASLTSGEAAEAIAQGLGELDSILCPLSDGGEGFLSVVARTGGTLEQAPTEDALGRPILAPWLRMGETVLVELASVAGLWMLSPAERDPLRASTFGVGRLIQAAWDRKPFERLVLALGGSATVDGGAGLLEALGLRLLDRSGRPIPRGGAGLLSLDHVEIPDSPIFERMTLALDVENSLLGPRGASRVYGPQKGASPEELPMLEEGLRRLAGRFGVEPSLPGLGAAGGVPVALSVLGAELVSGFEWLARWIELDRQLDAVDLVVTGEGRLDSSSFEGKVVGRLAVRCRAKGLPLYVIAGSVDPELALGEIRAFPLPEIPRQEQMRRAASLLTESARRIVQSLA